MGISNREFAPLPDEQPARSYKFIQFADAINSINPNSWIINKLVPSTGLMSIYGAPGAGKSFIAVDLAAHIACGKPYKGRYTRKKAVVYVAAEAGEGMKRRMHAVRHANDAVFEDFYLLPETVALGTPDVDAFIKSVKDGLEGVTPGVIIIDTLARSLGAAEENSASDMMKVVNDLQRIESAFKCLVIVVHHTGKDAAKGMRGSNALHGACDMEWAVDKKPNSTVKTVKVAKNKEGEDNVDWAFKLKVIEWGVSNQEEVDQFGVDVEPFSTCQIEWVDSDEAKSPTTNSDAIAWRKAVKSLTGDEKDVYKYIDALMARSPQQLPMGPEYPNCKGVTRDAVRDETAFSTDILGRSSKDTFRQALKRAIDGLESKKVICTYGGYIWYPISHKVGEE